MLTSLRPRLFLVNDEDWPPTSTKEGLEYIKCLISRLCGFPQTYAILRPRPYCCPGTVRRPHISVLNCGLVDVVEGLWWIESVSEKDNGDSEILNVHDGINWVRLK